jgi:hypothetical protein
MVLDKKMVLGDFFLLEKAIGYYLLDKNGVVGYYLLDKNGVVGYFLIDKKTGRLIY